MLKKKHRESIPGKSIVTRSLLKYLITCIFVFTLCLTSTSLSQALEPLIKGVEYYKKGEYDKALPEFLQAHDAFPDDADISMYVGLTYLHLKDNEKAIEYFEMAVALNPYNLDAHFQLGAALLQIGKHKEAITHLEEVYTFEPERDDLGYLLGNAYYNLGQYEKALEYLEAGKSTDKTMEGFRLYYVGLIKEHLGQSKEARIIFREVETLDPTAPTAGPSRRLSQILAIEERLRKRLDLTFSTRLQYDNNVPLAPTHEVFGLTEKESIAESLFMRGEYALIKTPKWELAPSYAFHQTMYNSRRSLDVQGHIASLDVRQRGQIRRLPYQAGLTLSYHHQLSDYDSSLVRYIIRPIFILTESPHNMTLFQYSFQLKNFKDEPRNHEDDRDSAYHEAGFTHFLRSRDGRHYVKAGYFRELESAQGQNWDMWSNRFNCGFQYTLPKDFRFNTEFNYSKVHYDRDNIFFSNKRRDIDRIASAMLSRDMGEHITVSFEYMKRRNNSTIQLYDFDKNLFSVGFTYRY